MGDRRDLVGYGMGGKGGGGSARTPVEQPDSLHNTSYAVVMDIISNGEIEGWVHEGLPLRDIYLDGTPVQNADGSLNFHNTSVEFRPGNNSQDAVPGFQLSASTTQDGREIKNTQAWTQLISNQDVTAVRLNIFVPQMVRTISSGEKVGDRVGSSVDLAFDIKVGSGAFVEVLQDTITGKTISGYTRTYRLELPDNPNKDGWTLRVRRLTADSESDTLVNKTQMRSFVEVVDGKFSYPMTAYNVLKVDAQQFQSIPTRAYHLKGRRIRVPTNYDPETRTYTGVWDGTFKIAYSNNPAWIYYDMVLNPLYGLGDRIDASMVDRYALYQVAAYCDQLVPDGMGGMEPRFVCNLYIQGQQDALRVLNDLTSIFRGMSFWANGQIHSVADMPSDPVYTYTNANVVDGVFTYAGAAINTLKTVALVSYNDPTDFYRSKVEAVEDREGIKRYGVRKTELTAIGCDSRGQAQRVGLYHLYTSRMETGGLTFSVGLDGVIPMPGSLIKIADANRAGRRIGGRVSDATANTLTLDKVDNASIGDDITVTLPDATIEKRKITNIDGNIITVNDDFSIVPNKHAIWSIDASDLVTLTARVVSVRERDGIVFDIEAIESHPDKWDAIDDNVRLDPLPVSVVPPRVVGSPENVEIEQHFTTYQGSSKIGMEISWDAVEHATYYEVQWRRDNSSWISVSGGRINETTVTIDDIHSGEYVARVRAFNSLGVPSLFSYSIATQLDGIDAAPPVLTSLTTSSEVMAIRLDWSYPTTPNIISNVEIRSSLTDSFAQSEYLTTVAYPATSYTLYGLGYGNEMWFWARLIDKNGLEGDWFPLENAIGRYGISSSDSTDILGYLTGKIGEGQLSEGLIDEITEGAAEGIQGELIGALTGEDTTDATWWTGDDGSYNTFVGTASITSAYNHGDFLEAQRTQILSARMDDSIAGIQNTLLVQASDVSALAQEITLLSAKVGEDIEATVEELTEAIAEVDGQLSSRWQVRTQVRSDGRVVQAGVALGAAINDDGTSRSEFLVQADTIAFLAKLNGALHSPFIVDTVNDSVILSNAFIGNASIGSAKFANWLESDATGPGGVPVLRLNFRTGEIQLNPSSTGQGRMSLTNNVIQVYDNSNTLRVRMGIWS